MRKLITVIYFLFLVISTINSQEYIESFNISNKNIQKTIICDSLDFLRITVNYKPVIAIDSTRILNGRILELTQEKIRILPSLDIIDIDYSCDSSYYRKQWKSNTKLPTSIKISDISKIEYQSYSAQQWSDNGFASIIIGSLTTLIVAPLISINYKDGSFNSKRYFSTAAIGLGFVSIGIPITIISRKKTYYFKNRINKNRTKIWSIGNNP